MTYPLDTAADADALGVAAAPAQTAAVLRFPLRLRVALAVIGLPVIGPDDDTACAFIDRTRRAGKCAGCPMREFDRDETGVIWTCPLEDRATAQTVGQCPQFDAEMFDMDAWARISRTVCEVRA